MLLPPSELSRNEFQLNPRKSVPDSLPTSNCVKSSVDWQGETRNLAIRHSDG